MKKGDTLITAELSRLGRSVGHIAILVDELLNNGVKLIFIKENMDRISWTNIDKIIFDSDLYLLHLE